MDEFEVYGGIEVHTRVEFDEAYAKVCDVTDGVHVDFADSVFVPNTLLSLESVPLMNQVHAEAHLMVKDPLRYFDICAQKAFRRVIFHTSSLSNVGADAVVMAVEHGKSLGLQVGVCVEIGSELPDTEVLAHLDVVSIMAVRLGFSGGEFIEEQLGLVAQLHEQIPYLPIAVDGGVSDQTISKIKLAGATRVVSTSWLQRAENVRESYILLKNS